MGGRVWEVCVSLVSGKGGAEGVLAVGGERGEGGWRGWSRWNSNTALVFIV